MQELILVKGMVLKQEPYSEYDRRIVLLTTDRGKITCFARGARKPGSKFMAATNPFAFGEFTLFPGRNAYSLSKADISNYFEYMRSDLNACSYGMYFLEMMDYYSKENKDDKELLKLLYQSLRALESDKFQKRMVRSVFEIKTLMLEGEYPGKPSERKNGLAYSECLYYTLDFILNSSVEKLYTFSLEESVLEELTEVACNFTDKYIDHKFNSLFFLDL